jgi:membrane-associated phospholipid phosphatase
MHWRKVPSRTNGKVFCVVVFAFAALVAVSTVLLVLHFPA